MDAADPVKHPAFPKSKATPLRFKPAHDASKDRERDGRFDTHRRRHRKHRHRSEQSNEQGGHEHSSKHKHPNDGAKLDPDAAFRESLYDAMADDEGAQYWQEVYGQPVHEFPRVHEGPDGKLDRMTEDEYMEFVRAEMWKKTNAGFLEEKDRRAKARKEAEEREREARQIRERIAREDAEFRERVDASLRKGKQREERRKRAEAWQEYQNGWELLGQQSVEDVVPVVPWPTLEQVSDVPTSQQIEAFMRYAIEVGGATPDTLPSLLKVERVRWHPDKVQQRARGRLDEATIRRVTAVFQIIDDLWMKHKK